MGKNGERMSEGNFTRGPILGPLLKFAVPVIAAMFLQSLYGAVDLMIVGQYAESADVSAVSTGTQIMQTVTSVIAGLAMGMTILIGQKIGEEKPDEAGKAVGTGIVFFAALAVVLSVVMVWNTKGIASLMHAPAEAMDATCGYIRICSMGLLFIVAYNLLGALFRGIGNSRIPLISVAIAAVCNVAGDLLLVRGMHMGASGAALATVISQGISVVLSFLVIRRIHMSFTLRMKDIRYDASVTGRILHFGIPIALMDFLVGLSFLVILAIVNSLGLEASAGVGVAEKVCAFIMLIPSAFGQSMASFVAQNYGAGKMDRAYAALRYGILTSFAVGCVMGWLSFFHGDILCSIFTKDPAVMMQGWQYLKAYAIDCLLTAFIFCYIGYFNGCGYTRFVMIQGIIGAFCVRIPVSWLMSRVLPVSLFRIGLATPASSLVQTILFVIYLHVVIPRRNNAAHQEDI